jgi:hypothetical protein
VNTNTIGQPQAPTNLPTPAPPGPALAENKGGLKQIVAGGVNYVNLMLGNMYWLAPSTDQPVLQLDGVWTFIAVTAQQFQQLTGMAPNEDLNAYGAIAGRAAGYYALVDTVAIAANLEGADPNDPAGYIQPITFMVVKNRELAAQITNAQGSTMAVLAPLNASSAPAEKKKGAAPILIAAAAGAAGLLIGGPAVGLAAGGVTYLVAS